MLKTGSVENSDGSRHGIGDGPTAKSPHMDVAGFASTHQGCTEDRRLTMKTRDYLVGAICSLAMRRLAMPLLVVLVVGCLGRPVIAQDRISDEEYNRAVATGREVAQIVTSDDADLRGDRRRAMECGQLLVAEGDSWFSYYRRSDIIKELVDHGWAIFSTAGRGDTLQSMIYDQTQRSAFNSALHEAFDIGSLVVQRDNGDCEHSVPRRGYPKAILLSVGGNDIIEALEFLLEHGLSSSEAPRVNSQILDGLFYRLHRILVEYISMVRQLCKYHVNGYRGDDDVSCGNIPIFVHGYDYPNPSGIGYDVFTYFRLSGPWVRPAFESKDNVQNASSIIHDIIDRYNKLLEYVVRQVSSTPNTDSNPVRYLDFRDTIQGRFRDELHPNSEAARELAYRISDAIVSFHQSYRTGPE